MFGPRLTTVFRSRWRAVWWALTVLIGVWWSIPRGGDKTEQADSKDVEAVAQMLQDQAGKPASSENHVNPWAKDKQ